MENALRRADLVSKRSYHTEPLALRYAAAAVAAGIVIERGRSRTVF
jgi:hypothetical protein